MTPIAIDERPRRAALTLGLCFPAALLEGFDIQSMGLAAPRMAPALGLSRAELGPLFSASIVGLLIGAAVFGRLADRFGRRVVLIGCMALFGLFSLATALLVDARSLLVVRLLAGLGLGGALPNLVALCAEAVAPERRAKFVTRLACGLPFGGALCGLTAAALPWRDIFWLGGAGPLILAPAMALALPESQAFLACREAPRAATGAAGRPGLPHVLLGEGRAVSTLLLWTASFGSLLTLYVMLNWLPTLMGDKGLSKPQASTVSTLFNLGAGVATLMLAELLERRRRGLTIGLWYVGLLAAVWALAVSGPGFAAGAAAGLAAGFFVSSAPLPLYGMAPGYYDTEIRGTGVGAAVAVGRLGAIVGPLLAAALLGLGAGADGVLLALLPIAVIAGAATMALVGRPTRAD